jgi:hypothetical protein
VVGRCCAVDGKQAEGAITVRFEDVVTRPIETCDWLYRSLDMRWSEDGKFEFKVRPYGTDRMADAGVGDKDFIRIGAEDASQQIDASVLRAEQSGYPIPNGERYGISREPRPRGSVMRRPVVLPR